MSGIANLYNVPGNDAERAQWAFAHMAHHRDINRTIYELISVSLPEFILDQINVADTGFWEYQHQQMHDNQNAILGIAGFDLTGLNWNKQNELAGWIYLNSTEHFQASNILGIG